MNFGLDITTETDPQLGGAVAAVPVFDGVADDAGDVLDPWAFTTMLIGPTGPDWGDGTFTITFDASGIGGSGGIPVRAAHRPDGLHLELIHLRRHGTIPWEQIRATGRSFLDAIERVAVVQPAWEDLPCAQMGTLYGEPFDSDDADQLRDALDRLPHT